ncbi:MAG TPA: hypothetical protein VNH18_22900 [Bryobacteraceae bacterium]|nr:hypothetical protein [Bryobacteraceae bacterium]
MASITIRQLDDSLKGKLRLAAASHGRSMEAEAREILRIALGDSGPPYRNIGTALYEAFQKYGGFDLKREQQPIPPPMDFDE